MPSRIFDVLDTYDFSEGYTSGPSVPNPTVTSVAFGQITIDGTQTNVAPLGAGFSFAYRQLAKVNFQNPPAIPNTGVARITQVRLRRPNSVNINITGDNPVVNALTPNPVPILVVPYSNGALAHASSEAGSAADVVVDYDPPITYADLVAIWQQQLLDIVLENAGSSGVIGGAHIDFNIQYTGGWQLEVTYFETFSWYLNVHQEIIGGVDSTIVDSIVQVITGDPPPIGSIFYGTSDDFPTIGDIPEYRWYDPDVHIWLPNPQPITPRTPPWIPRMPDIDFTGDIAATFALEALFVYILKPSGIYTLTANKRHDTLYERLGAITTINVAIPEPFIQTAYMSDEDTSGRRNNSRKRG